MLLSCSYDNKSEIEKINDEDQKNQSTTFENEELSTAAIDGATFEGNYYSVMAQKDADLFKDSAGIMVRVKKTLNRGDVYSKLLKARQRNNKIPISVPDAEGVFFIEESTDHFDQPLEGMRFPVQGIIQIDDAEIEYFDQSKGERINKKLEKGTLYYFVHYKDCAVINVWDEEKNKPIEGMFCGDLNVQQVDQHIKINPKYKSTLEKWFK